MMLSHLLVFCTRRLTVMVCGFRTFGGSIYILNKWDVMKNFIKKVASWLGTQINRYAVVLVVGFAVTVIFTELLPIDFPGMPMLMGSMIYYGFKASKTGNGFDIWSFIAANVPGLYVSFLHWL